MPRDAPVLEVLQPEDGGVAEHALRLTLGLQARGWPVEVALSPGSAIKPALVEAGVPIHELGLVRAPGPADLAAGRALRALDRARRYGIVHGHSSKAGALVRSALSDGRRLVYTPHCFAFAARFAAPKRFLYWAIEQALVPRSARIVAVCDWERAEGVRRLRGARSRIRVIENGVPPCPEAPPDPALVAFRADRPLAGMVTALRAQKDPLTAVRAFADLVERGPPPGRLAIVGNGPLRDEVEGEIARLGLGEDVRCFPFGGSVAPYLRAMDLFVLSSAWEAFPLSLLEAMSCGLPVVATSVGGVPEAVEDGVTGRLVAPGSPRELADALEALLGDRALLRSLGERGRAAFEARFDLDRMVDRTADLYREVLDGASTA